MPWLWLIVACDLHFRSRLRWLDYSAAAAWFPVTGTHPPRANSHVSELPTALVIHLALYLNCKPVQTLIPSVNAHDLIVVLLMRL
ncbi:hypothetical protein BKA62DRAFT_700270, partial [Auriculariales sp. MPI-PUGE-AT-0066]